MLLPGRDTWDTRYRYGFNGKENDLDFRGFGNITDYGARIYNARLGKFLSVDALTKEYPWNSTYAFAENDVIRSIDLDGNERKIVIHWVDKIHEDGALKVTKTQTKITSSDKWVEVYPNSKKPTGHVYATTETYYYFYNDKRLYKGKDQIEEIRPDRPKPSANYDYTSDASMAQKNKDDESYAGSMFYPGNWKEYAKITQRDLNAPDNLMNVDNVSMGMLALSAVSGTPGALRSMLKADAVAINGPNVFPSLSRKSAGDIASQAAKKNATNFECMACADGVVTALKNEGRSGTIIDISVKNGGNRTNIFSDKAGEVISTSGNHRGVLVEGKVYDNIHTDGVDFNTWMRDFHTPSKEFTIKKTDF